MSSSLVEVEAYLPGDCFALTFPTELPVLPDVIRVREAADMLRAVELTDEFNSYRDRKMDDWRAENYRADRLVEIKEKGNGR